MRLVKASQIPQFIRKTREEGGNPFQDMLPEEDVVHFTRYVKVYKTEKDRTIGPWINAITVITRIRIDDWLKEMDDPSDVVFVSSTEGDLEQQSSERVYHLHLVITEAGKNKAIDNIHHYRLILNKKGIMRMELMET
jgi:hypothetical protein